MYLERLKKPVFAIALVALAACGSDSVGPGTVDADDALRSLARGFNSTSRMPLPFALSASAFGTAARGLDQVDVTIGGTPHTMYALGLRVTYPTGTCMESLFPAHYSLGLPPGCTPPPLGLALVLWETRSGSRPPDRMVFIAADVGTASFDITRVVYYDENRPLPAFDVWPAFAMYIDGGEEFWTSIGGSLTSQVTTTGETCSVTPPPFAKSSTCNFATFDETGSITFAKSDLSLEPLAVPMPRQTTELVIPRQNILGIVQAITEIQPITFPTLQPPTAF